MAHRDLELASAMGKRMAECRKKCGLTQEAVAELASISHQQYSKTENGKACPGADTLLRISIALQTSADYLLTGNTPSRKHVDTIDLLDQMSANQLKLANRMMKCIIETDGE